MFRKRHILFKSFVAIFYIASVIIILSGTKKKESLNYMSAASTDNVSSTRDTSLKYYLALGDSYTIGQSVLETERFPVQTVAMLRTAGYKMAEAEIIATTGWTTANLLTALKTKTPAYAYDLVSLLIGVNNQYQGRSITKYRTEFTALLEKSILLAGNRPGRVFVLSIPDYSVTPFAEPSERKRIALEIDSFNIVNSHLAASYKVNYLNVTDESRKAAMDSSLIAADDLHFSGKEYSVWAKLLTQMIKDTIN